MKKILLLIPCLMLDNNRQKNIEAMNYAKDNYNVDEIVCYDQEFKSADYIQGIKYIGKQKTRVGFVKARNELIKYFYNSNYDYAIWVDANKTISHTSLNDFNTIINALRTGKITSYVILATLGIQISQERMIAKKRKDYFKKVYLLRCKRGYEWLHGCIMINFKKYFNDEIYIDKNCNNYLGVAEDIFFIRLLRTLYNIQLCPSVIVNTPSNKTSTWMNKEDGYNYPKNSDLKTNILVQKNKKLHTIHKDLEIPNIIAIDRIKDKDIENLKSYKPRKKNK